MSVRGGAAEYLRLQSIHESAWIAPSAIVQGRIHVGERSSLWHHVVARAECQEIRIGRLTNLQDFVMVHVGFDVPTRVGDFCSITHRVTLHGCEIGDACLIGPGAVIMDGAVIGEGSIVGAGTVVPEGRRFPPHSVVVGVPARQIAERDSSRANRMNAWVYHRNAEFTRRGEYRAWEGEEFEAWRAAKQTEIESDLDLSS